MVRYLLQGGADLDDRALGVFFQPARISQFEADQNFMKFRQLDKNQLYRYILKFDSRGCDLKSRTLLSLGANTSDTRPENPTINMLVYTNDKDASLQLPISLDDWEMVGISACECDHYSVLYALSSFCSPTRNLPECFSIVTDE